MLIHLDDLANIPLDLAPGDIVYLSGDLAAGKTTLVQTLLARHGVDPSLIKSPTYTYYQIYTGNQGWKFAHFDLYRVPDYETFLNIGGQEILDNPLYTSLVEWPDILEHRYPLARRVTLQQVDDPLRREISWDFGPKDQINTPR